MPVSLPPCAAAETMAAKNALLLHIFGRHQADLTEAAVAGAIVAAQGQDLFGRKKASGSTKKQFCVMRAR